MKLATLIGSIGSKPVVKRSKGTTYCNFSVAVDDSDRDGNAVTEWYEVVAFGALASSLERAESGDEVCVHGPFRQRTYTGLGGVQHHEIEIRAFTIKFLRCPRRGRPAKQPAAAAP
ncbi:MAG TPA: single-stranded DNA-binding protein [Thermoanaerobaculia bacterium]|nr:single-stranded DNA-binding protein [Thermoanaerobaculia bacterium]